MQCLKLYIHYYYNIPYTGRCPTPTVYYAKTRGASAHRPDQRLRIRSRPLLNSSSPSPPASPESIFSPRSSLLLLFSCLLLVFSCLPSLLSSPLGPLLASFHPSISPPRSSSSLPSTPSRRPGDPRVSVVLPSDPSFARHADKSAPPVLEAEIRRIIAIWSTTI